MKKFISVLLALTLMLSLAACGGNGDADTTTGATGTTAAPETTVAPETTEAPTEETETTTAPAVSADSLEGIINSIYENNPVEFGTMAISIDLEDTSEEGLWTLKAFTGLDNADMISEAWVSEAMIGSIPYSLVLVRVADAANAETVADAMKSGIDTRKWICVQADEVMVAGSGDVVMLVMLGAEYDAAQPFVDAFSTVMGGTDFVK